MPTPRTCLASIGALASLASAQPAIFVPLPDLPGGTEVGRAWSVDSSGSHIIGVGNDGADAGAIWDHAAGWSPITLPRLPSGTGANGRACSDDGLVAFGDAANAAGFRQPVRWAVSGSIATLLPLGYPSAGGYSGAAFACSVDGAVACGEVLYQPAGLPPPLPITQAFRWTSAGMIDLGTLPGVTPFPGGVTTARAISADGSVVVGYAQDASYTYRPWRWTAGTGIVDISEGTWSGFARGCSPDGLVVVGSRNDTGVSLGFLWTPQVGRRDLGAIGPIGPTTYDSSTLFDVCAGGRRGCGINLVTTISGSQLACIWEPRSGWRSLKQVLEESGVNMTGWTLAFATSISDDGRTIAGYGTNPAGFSQGWIAIVPMPCPADLDNGSGAGAPDGGVDVNDLLFFLARYAAGTTAVDLHDGSGTGLPDGAVDVNDLLYFLARYEGGC